MYKSVRTPLRFASRARPPLRQPIATRQLHRGHAGLIFHQPVRIVQPWHLYRQRLLNGFTTMILTFIAMKYLDSFLDDDEKDDKEENQNGHVLNTIFIPLWFPQERQPHDFDRDSPEWKGFVSFYNNGRAQNQARNQLVDIVTGFVGMKFGSPATPLRHWLRWKFPNSPYPEYDQPGLTITEEDEFSIELRSVSPEYAAKMNRIFWPDDIVVSLGKALHYLAGLQFEKIQKLSSSGSEEQQHEQHHNPSAARSIARPVLPVTGNQHQGQPQTSPGDPSSSSANSKEVIQSKSTTASEDNSTASPSKGFLPPIVSIPQLPDDFRKAIAFYRRELAFRRMRTKFFVPRGGVILGGTIEIQEPRGHHVFHVLACYDPSENKWTNIRLFRE
ncbi:MAG: hypothetical protein M1834_004661 [Cirrosporium novae-zelandiae]|nr:MAG: hypothetical protein M1834_004661 [Cirrosporium novae-zelandiae]